MIKTIDMQVLRYINLFNKVSNVSPKHCFVYNTALIFTVPKNQVQKAIGDDSRNLKKVNEIIGKKIKVVAIPRDIRDAESFIKVIISPVEINNVEVEGNVLIINAGSQSKAMLIGRNKKRLDEMKKIVKEYFGKELKII
jgi:transcription termination/antitermination protein NusA